MIAVKEINTRIVAVPNPKYDLLLTNLSETITARYVVAEEVQADQQIKMLVDTAPRGGIRGDRFREMTLCGTSHQIKDYQGIKNEDISKSLQKIFDQKLLTLNLTHKIHLSLYDWAYVKLHARKNLNASAHFS
jgi:hypothetical protein